MTTTSKSEALQSLAKLAQIHAEGGFARTQRYLGYADECADLGDNKAAAKWLQSAADEQVQTRHYAETARRYAFLALEA